MSLNTLWLPVVVLLALNACSSDRDLEDPIRAIQNRQAFLDANTIKAARTLEEPKMVFFPGQKTSQKSLASDFDVDEATGKIDFKTEVVYFEYDDATLTDAGMQQLSSLAHYMQEHRETQLSIEGHCDQRGSVEYNLALGQRRSDTVKKYLATMNIPVSRLDSVSFGKERPAVSGDSEAAFAKNRRVEFAFKIYTTESISRNESK